VADYVRYRPRYPLQLVPLLHARVGLRPEWVVADIGSGTGFSAEPFLEFGNTVHGVEPNAEMRAAGERLLARSDRFHSVAGTAEQTTLPDASIDLITAGQAFHWFDRQRARAEFRRILKPGGCTVLFWNRRDVSSTPFARDYEALLLRFGTDYEQIRHDRLGPEEIGAFLGSFEQAGLEYEQLLDYEGLKGRLLSSSYTPSAADPRREAMLRELRALFDRHQQDNRVTLHYDTDIFIGR
jgi:SAM-dependent methyltransferase